MNCAHCNRGHLSELHEVAVLLFKTSGNETTPKSVVAAISVTQTEPANNESNGRSGSSQSFTGAPSNIFMVDKSQICGERPFLMGMCNGKKCKALIDFGSELTLMHMKMANPNTIREEGSWIAGSPLDPNEHINIGKRTRVTFKNNDISVEIPVLVTEHLQPNLIIIGNDTVSTLLPGNPKTCSVPTILGNVEFKTPKQICAIDDVINSSDQINEEEKISIRRQDNGKYIVPLPFFGNI